MVLVSGLKQKVKYRQMFKLNLGNFNPDPVWHRNISFAKSAVRIAAGVALMLVDINVWATISGALFIAAEVLGIVEEVV